MSYSGKGLFTQATSGLSSAFTALAGENSSTITLQQIQKANAAGKTEDGNLINSSFLSYLTTNFSTIDQNGDGTIDSNDIQNYMSNLGTKGMTYDEIATLCNANGSNSLANTVLTYFNEIDKNGDGRVTAQEISEFSMSAERDKLEDEFGKFKPTSLSVYYEADSSADEWSSVLNNSKKSDVIQ